MLETLAIQGTVAFLYVGVFTQLAECGLEPSNDLHEIPPPRGEPGRLLHTLARPNSPI